MGFLDNVSSIPVKVYDSSEEFIKTIFGPSFSQLGEALSDEVKLLLLKRQIKIFKKTEKILADNGLKAKPIALKTLKPLMDKIGVEDDENIQDLWANLLANITQDNSDEAINVNCINILSQLTTNEAKLTNFFYGKFMQFSDNFLKMKNGDSVYEGMKVAPSSYFEFDIQEFYEHCQVSASKLSLYEDRLLAFGVFKKVDPDLKDYEGDTRRNKEYALEYSNKIYFSNFGLYFIELCTQQPKIDLIK